VENHLFPLECPTSVPENCYESPEGYTILDDFAKGYQRILGQRRTPFGTQRTALPLPSGYSFEQFAIPSVARNKIQILDLNCPQQEHGYPAIHNAPLQHPLIRERKKFLAPISHYDVIQHIDAQQFSRCDQPGGQYSILTAGEG
jgi:hypothetical protein